MRTSAVTKGELTYGAEISPRHKRNLAEIQGLIARLEVAPFEDHIPSLFRYAI